MLESIVARSARAAVVKAAAADAPQRFVQVHSCHGWVKKDWIPTRTGVDFPLSTVLQPLQNVKDKVLVLSKMQNDAALKCQAPDDYDTHARGNATLFTGANVIWGTSKVQVGPSMDQIYAQSIAGKTPVGSLQLGLKEFYDGGNRYPESLMKYISYQNKNTVLVDQTDPVALFDLHFAGASTGADKQAQDLLRQQRKSVLDGVIDQANALKGKLGKDDAEKLDQYFTGIRALELQFSAGVSAACGAGTRPSASQVTQYDKLANAFMDLTTLAFSCDLTRSVSFNFGSGHNDHRYSFVPGGVFDGHHNMTHALDRSGVYDVISRVNTWEVSVAARLAEGLKAIPEGSGTMLDNSIMMISTEQSVAGAHGYRDLPVVLVGGAGGKMDGNRHVQVGTGENFGNLTEVQLAVLQALGVDITSYGGFDTTRAYSLKA